MNETKEMNDPTLQIGDTVKMQYPPKYNNGWISVKDRLPEHNQFVLASDKNGNMMVVRCDINRNGENLIDYVFMMTDLTRQVIGVSHWMPLPEMPK